LCNGINGVSPQPKDERPAGKGRSNATAARLYRTTTAHGGFSQECVQAESAQKRSNKTETYSNSPGVTH